MMDVDGVVQSLRDEQVLADRHLVPGRLERFEGVHGRRAVRVVEERQRGHAPILGPVPDMRLRADTVCT